MARPKIPENEKFLTLSVRLDQTTIAAIDAYARDHARRHFGGLRSARSRALRTLITRGLDTARTLEELPAPGETPAEGSTPTAGKRHTVRG
jgi:hypothetical protein